MRMSLSPHQFFHPSDSTLPRFLLWLVLSSLGVALLAQLFGPGYVSSLGLLVLPLGGIAVTPPATLRKQLSVTAWAIPLIFLGLALLTVIAVVFEPYFRSLPIWGEAGPRRDSQMPRVYQVVIVVAWLTYAIFEIWRFGARRVASAV